jgi:cyclomaltodextrinase
MTKISTPEWVKDAVFYQIFPDRFAKSTQVDRRGLKLEEWDTPPSTFGFKGGDLLGVMEHLNYLQELGITAIYFNPVFASASNHRYHTYDYYNVDPLLGGNAALQALLDECHNRGIRIILDGVFNHASRGFWQFHHVLENGSGSPYVDWFHFDKDRLSGKRTWGAYPSFKEINDLQAGKGSLEAIGYQAWWDLPALPKFNTDAPAVREFIFNVAEFWLKFGIDGWRLDVPSEINDDAFWMEFRRRVKAINPEAYIVGEIWHESRRWLQGDQFDAVMNYPVTIAELGFFCGDKLDIQEARRAGGYQGQVKQYTSEEFANSIDTILGWYDPAITQVQLNILDSHDTPRFITCASGDKASLKLAMLFMFTYPGAPCIYYGDEIGMDGRQDPDCRKSFPWDQSRWDMGLLEFIKSLIKLRRSFPVLRRGDFRRLYASDGVYAYGRQLGDKSLIVVLNAAENEQRLDVSLDTLPNIHRSLPDIVFGEAEVTSSDNRMKIKLASRSGAVLSI